MKFELKCCGKNNPIGVDKQNIRLSFALDGSVALSGFTVTLFRADTMAPVCSLPASGTTAWLPPESVEELTAYAWQVSAVTAQGETLVSEKAYFETAPDVWQGKWIGTDAQPGQVLEFCKDIRLDEKPVKARLYICGLGYFQATVNGMRLDDSYFIPPVTDYTTRPQLPHSISGHRITFYTYDVTKLLHSGSNVLTAQVSDGYYGSWEKIGFEPLPDMTFGQPGLIYELHIQDRTGLQRIISDTDTGVRITNTSSRLYCGDRVDFTYKPQAYQPAKPIQAPDGVMTSPKCQDDRLYQVLAPVRSWETKDGTVFDFGVNHSGGLQFTALSQGENDLCVQFAEVLNPDGSLNVETGAYHAPHVTQPGLTKSIYQSNTYHLQSGSNSIAPVFGWFCYRYALIRHPEEVKLQDVKSLFICMDLEQNGEFSCGDDTLNQINEMFLQTLRCNMHSGALSDCPHRERLPYTGDGAIVMKSVCYNLSALDFYYKWFWDILDSQYDDGMIPNTAPHLGGGGGYAWGNALCVVTKQLYALTGDLTVARKGYEAIGKWLAYYDSKRDENYIIRSNSHRWLLGDWLAPEVVTSNVYYISTVCYLQAIKTALFLAEILEPEACEKWNALKEAVTDGINRVFFNPEKRTYGNGVQGENMLALAEEIVPGQYRQKMKEDLYHHYTEITDGHLDTGIVLTPVLINYLTDSGYQNVAWQIMTAKTYPSYFSLMDGDTTFSEHWSKKWPDYHIGEPGNSQLVKGGGDLSHCHPMFGSVAAWLYERVAGLDLSELYCRTVHIKPFFMDCLNWASAHKKTAFGKVSVAWSKENGQVTLNLGIPQGLTAQCCFPASCDSLTDSVTGQCYLPEADGYFRFQLGSGQRTLRSGQAVENTRSL